jgi:hypothetical protein
MGAAIPHASARPLPAGRPALFWTGLVEPAAVNKQILSGSAQANAIAPVIFFYYYYPSSRARTGPTRRRTPAL